MSQIIVVGGAPGSGKTTVTRMLHKNYESVMIDLGWLRMFHLDPEWKRQSEQEEGMAFENLIFIVRNYVKHGYTHIFVNDLLDHRIQQIPSLFDSNQFMIVTITVNDVVEHKKRVLNPERDSGYRDYEKAIAWNKSIGERPLVENEVLIDSSNLTAEETAKQIQDLIDKRIN